MADNIKSYRKERIRREQKQIGYKEKLLKHKLVSIYRILLVTAVLLALAALAYIQYKRHVYTSYEVVSSVARESAGGTVDLRLGNAILTYSKDGAHCTDTKGTVTWNQTYEIQDAQVSVCDGTVAIGDYNGRSIYVQNSEKQLGEITTTMPIRNIAVSSNGNVTAVLADTDVTWINTYSADGEMLYKGQSHMDDAGYPAAISLSPNGELLCVSYLYVDAGVLKTNVVFYNFGPVGENNSDYTVGVYIYTDMLVPYVQFMNDSTAFAVGDSRLMIYSGSQKPVPEAEYLFDEEIQAVYYSDSYVGLVFLSEENDSRYRMDVYNTEAEKVGSYYITIDYTDIFFDKDMFVAYSDTECQIMTLSGIEKYSGSFSKTVRLMMSTSGAYRYMLVTDDSIDTIQLR